MTTTKYATNIRRPSVDEEILYEIVDHSMIADETILYPAGPEHFLVDPHRRFDLAFGFFKVSGTGTLEVLLKWYADNGQDVLKTVDITSLTTYPIIGRKFRIEINETGSNAMVVSGTLRVR